MLNDRHSLALTGILTISIFVFGILDVLDNFVVLTVLTIIFFAIVINIFYAKLRHEEPKQEEKEAPKVPRKL